MALLYEDEGYKIRGAIMEVHGHIGAGFLEGVYQECLEEEFTLRNIPSKSQPALNLVYKGKPLNHVYQPDFICYDKIIVEIKSVQELNHQHVAQLINYLKASDLKLGYLVNFSSHPEVTIKRFLWNVETNENPSHNDEQGQGDL